MENIILQKPITQPTSTHQLNGQVNPDSMAKRTIRFIINPRSGIRKKINIEQLIEQEIDKNIFDFDIVHTEYAGHATELAAEAASENIDIVVAVGGDGAKPPATLYSGIVTLNVFQHDEVFQPA